MEMQNQGYKVNIKLKQGNRRSHSPTPCTPIIPLGGNKWCSLS